MNAVLDTAFTPRALLLPLLALLLSVFASCSSGAQPAARNAEIFGEWWTSGFRARVRIERCADDALCGRIVWSWDPRIAQAGQEVISGMRRDGEGAWSGGRAFNPDDGNTYAATLRRLDADRIVIEGCLLLLCREQVWFRVRERACTPLQSMGSRQ